MKTSEESFLDILISALYYDRSVAVTLTELERHLRIDNCVHRHRTSFISFELWERIPLSKPVVLRFLYITLVISVLGECIHPIRT